MPQPLCMKLFNKLIRKALHIISLCLVCACWSCTHSSNYDVDRAVYPIKGIDLSAHNGLVDFQKVKDDTVSFVILKATEGTDFCDAMFAHNYKEARKAGLKVGAYHFFRFDTPGKMQAEHFISSLSGRMLDLPLVIDVEDWQNAKGVSASAVVRQLRQMIDTLAALGHRVMIYTNRAGYAKYVKGNFPDTHLWYCTFSGEPPHGVDKWALWQHSHSGKVNGVEGNVDVNTFNGKEPAFRAFTMRVDTIPGKPSAY